MTKQETFFIKPKALEAITEAKWDLKRDNPHKYKRLFDETSVTLTSDRAALCQIIAIKYKDKEYHSIVACDDELVRFFRFDDKSEIILGKYGYEISSKPLGWKKRMKYQDDILLECK